MSTPPIDTSAPSDPGEAPVRVHPHIVAQILVMTSERERHELYARRRRVAIKGAALMVGLALGGLSIYEAAVVTSPLWAAVSMAACIPVLYYAIRPEG